MARIKLIQRGFLALLREALRHGPRGAQLDTTLMVDSWDFRPQEISVTVHLWHGEADRDASPAMAHYLAVAIPNSDATFYQGEGRVSLFRNTAEDIFRSLLLLPARLSPAPDAAPEGARPREEGDSPLWRQLKHLNNRKAQRDPLGRVSAGRTGSDVGVPAVNADAAQ